MLKNEYFHKGGNDPAILAQMRELEYEAQRMQTTQRPPPGNKCVFDNLDVWLSLLSDMKTTPQLFKGWIVWIVLTTGYVPILWIGVNKTNHTICWRVIYPVDSVTHLSNN